MASLQVATGDRTVEPMIALAGCSPQHRIVAAGSKSIEMMLDLQRRGYLRGGDGELRPPRRTVRRWAG
jgi:hypothetical protein